MSAPTATLLDFLGRIMFHCAACGEALTTNDLVALGLRVPERGESAADYCDAELIDSIEHEHCTRATQHAG